MPTTPFFPPWRSRLAPMGQRIEILQQQSLCQLDQLFSQFLPRWLLSQTDEGPNSRERIYTLRRTLFGFLYQVLNPACPCREVVRQVQALFVLQGGRQVSQGTGGYCAARLRLPLEALSRLRSEVGSSVEKAATPWHQLHVKIIDGTCLRAPDTQASQREYPQSKGQKPGCGFPLIKLVGIFSLTTGALLGYARGNKHQHDLGLFQEKLEEFKEGDLVLADRGFNSYVTMALLSLRQAHCLFRIHKSRSSDLRKGKSLGKNDRLIVLKKPRAKPLWLCPSLWERVPKEMSLRVLRLNLPRKGFRTRSVTLVTTLLDAQKYRAEELARLYLRRWQIELWFRDIKTSMGMEELHCKSPEMLHKELEMFFLAYNLIRCLMAEAAAHCAVPLERLSFKGSVDATRQFSAAIGRARSKKKQAQLIGKLLEVIAKDIVPERPGRREPRAVKRRPKSYDRLSRPRDNYRRKTPKNGTLI